MATQTSGLDLNHWLYRFLALVIDSIITTIPAYIIYIVLQGILWPVSPYISAYWGYSWAPWWAFYVLFFFLSGFIYFIYSVILDVSWGATVGKRVLGLHVQMTDGSKVVMGKAIVRNISKIYELFLLLDWIIGIATAGQDRRQKFTDRIAGTTVVSLRQPFASATPPPPPPPPT